MAQLTDDCFAFGGRLIPLDEALSAAREAFPCVAQSTILPLREALTRPASTDVIAERAVPPHDNSAVDGYAVRHADLSAASTETTLQVHGYAAAGDRPEPLPRGFARRILTGAAMPAGADTVFMDEDVRAEGSSVTLPGGLRQGSNARKAGEDISAGSVIITAGHRLNAADLGLLASVGIGEISVLKPLKVALFSTGNEVREPGAALAPGQVYDANRSALMGLLTQAGTEILDLGILPDDRTAIDAALTQAKAKGADLILTSGGVSAGDHDVVRHVLEDRGSLLFWRLAVKPGRPIALGRFDGVPLIGLPGNPAAAAVMFYVVALPLIRSMEGAVTKAPTKVPVTLDFEHRKKADRVEFVRVQIHPDAQGRLIARKFPREGAGILSSVAWADGMIALEADRLTVSAGETGWFTAFDWSMAA